MADDGHAQSRYTIGSQSTASGQQTNGNYRPAQPYANGVTNDPSEVINMRRSSDSRKGRKRSQERDEGKGRSRSRTNSNKGHRTCKKCAEPLTGQFVRALGGTFHLDCFKCRDCGQIVASKFFPVDEEDGSGQFPLCETDYFRRLDLLCYHCGGALRGSYITALDRKYHIEHFTCSVCPTVFGAQDSYYEHEGKVYCHYHYSTQFAQRCNGCQTAILKQFVEIFRNGQNQHWHPECYMIHKFWNVRLAPNGPPPPRPDIALPVSGEERELIKEDEERMESKVYRIWSTLSTFEESSASCISDMLLHVSNGVYIDGIIVARKFIWHVDILFGAIDSLATIVVHEGLKELFYGREAKLLCKKVVAFFTLLSKTQETGVRKLGVTQELLSLVTGLAHYLKLLIRIGLQGALKLERERGTTEGLNAFLDELADLETIKDNEMKSLDLHENTAGLASQESDCCAQCNEPIDDECVMIYGRRWHVKPPHLHCSTCQRDLTHDLASAVFSEKADRVFCINHAGRAQETVSGFSHVTKLQQYVFLLKVALARLLEVLKTGGSLPHTSEDPNLIPYNNNDGYRPSPAADRDRRMGARSRSYAGQTRELPQEESSLEQTVGEMKRLRSTRNERTLSTTFRRARQSRILDDPSGVQPGSPSAHDRHYRENPRIEHDRDSDSGGRTKGSLLFGVNQDGLTLDDIPRIVAAEQAREQRPNASRYAGENLLANSDQPKLINSSQRRSTGNDLLAGEPSTLRTKRYFSELSALEYLIVRTVAVITMQPMFDGHYTMEELLGLIETKKTTFWGKVSKALKNDPKTKKKGSFGVPLDVLVEREGAESTNGVGPGALKVPALIDDAVSAMRQMDMSVEGVFRKNGNIKRLKDTAEAIDNNTSVDLNRENAVQIAALLKKFLRDMPDPLMTFRLHKLWIASQKLSNEDDKRRCLHLICCLLPKQNRDTMEVLFSFLKWAASFSQVDEESGSKMDIHNLATVIAPNILYAPPPKQNTKAHSTVPQVDDSFLAIEAVNTLIKYNETFCQVPEDLQSILTDSSLHGASADMSTKEILARYGHIAQGQVQSQRTVEAADAPALSASNSQRSASNTLTMATRIDSDAKQTSALSKQSSVQPINKPNGISMNGHHDLASPKAPYSNTSHDEIGINSTSDDYMSSNLRSSYSAKIDSRSGIAG